MKREHLLIKGKFFDITSNNTLSSVMNTAGIIQK